jgi:hypothetical protein
MKKIMNSIIAVVVMSAFALTANAQNGKVVNGISTDNFAECQKYLIANPNDTIREVKERRLELTASADTTVTRNEGLTVIELKAGDKLYFAGYDVWQENGEIVRGNHYVVVRVNPLPAKVVADEAEVARVDSLAAQTQVLLKIASNNGRYPMIAYWYESDQHHLTDGRIVEAAHRPLGWSFLGEVGGRVSFNNSDLNGFVAMGGMRYTTRVFNAKRLQALAQATVGVVRLLEPDNAENAGKGYYTPSFNMVAGLGLPLDALRSSAVYLFGGVALDYEKTLTRKNDNGLLQSRNLNLHPKAGLMLVLEPDRRPNGITISLAYEPVSQTVQNQSSVVNHCVVATVSFQVGALRHWVKTVLK